MKVKDETKPVSIMDANGSAKSIIDWGSKCGLDNDQKRSFEIIAGSFILTFFDDCYDNLDEMINDGMSQRQTRNHEFLSEKHKLQLLVDYQSRRGDANQLICFLHGPGGSGKTTVIDLVMQYAEEYSKYLHYRFTSRTIVVTALTGVAASILLGETTHSAVLLNQKKEIEAEQVEVWAKTRLLVIDEISFADKHFFSKLDSNLRKLKRQPRKCYGGLNLVLAGDL